MLIELLEVKRRQQHRTGKERTSDFYFRSQSKLHLGVPATRKCDKGKLNVQRPILLA